MPIIVNRIPELPLTYRKSGRPSDVFKRGRRSRVPKGGWNQQSFQTPNGKAMLRDILMVRKLAIRENATILTKKLIEEFEREASEVIGRFASKVAGPQHKTIGSDLVTMVLNLEVPDHAAGLWEEALQELFDDGELDGNIIGVFRPHYQSTLDHIVRKTNVLLTGREVPVRDDEGDSDEFTSINTPEIDPRRPLTERQIQRLITAQADGLCNKVTRISETTRTRMRSFFRRALDRGDTVGNLFDKFRDEFAHIATTRVPTIVRNELSVAANEAQIISFTGNKQVTHCSVVGCQAIEDDSPTYHGVHTCNIRNVPVYDLPYIEFHINHTGSWVPSGFRNVDGSVPWLGLGNGEGIGHYDDHTAPRHTRPTTVGLGDVVRP